MISTHTHDAARGRYFAIYGVVSPVSAVTVVLIRCVADDVFRRLAVHDGFGCPRDRLHPCGILWFETARTDRLVISDEFAAIDAPP